MSIRITFPSYGCDCGVVSVNEDILNPVMWDIFEEYMHDGRMGVHCYWQIIASSTVNHEFKHSYNDYFKNWHKKRFRACKEELISAAMHPDRLMKQMQHYEDMDSFFDNL